MAARLYYCKPMQPARGVGEEADVIMTSWCADPQQNDEWVFRDWILNAEQGTETPRWWCPPAIMRTSRALLLASHESQYLRGLAVPSEATPPSFTGWWLLKSFVSHACRRQTSVLPLLSSICISDKISP